MTAPDGPHPTLAAGERFPLSQRERGSHRFSPSKQNPSPPAGERGQGERGAAGVHGVAEIGFTTAVVFSVDEALAVLRDWGAIRPADIARVP